MRELKFRAWTHQNPSMPWSQKFVAITGNGEQMVPIGGTFTGVWHTLGDDAEGLIIEQYTGLKDKNGKEIYEGDIIRCHGDDRFIAPVIRHAKSGGFCWVSCYDEICFIPESDEVEVIGNIHENADLLEEEE